MIVATAGTAHPHSSHKPPGCHPRDPAFSQNQSRMAGKEMLSPGSQAFPVSRLRSAGMLGKSTQWLRRPVVEEKSWRGTGGGGLITDLHKLILGLNVTGLAPRPRAGL